MNQDTFNLNNKVYSNNNNLLFGIINDLQQILIILMIIKLLKELVI